MKFITEEDLRILYRKAPFDSYDIGTESRLTPGARQFLNDKKIRIKDNFTTLKKKIEKTSEKKEEAVEKPLNHNNQSFELKKKTLQAQFLEGGLQFLEEDVLLAKKLFDLERMLSYVDKQGKEIEIDWEPCEKFQKDNIHKRFEDCFEVTGFHAQTKEGKKIVFLHRLRCSLRELQAESGYETLNPIINHLSQMICLKYGGNACSCNQKESL